MPLRHVRLNPEDLDFISNSVESGRFANSGELLQAALQALRREERKRRERACGDARDKILAHVADKHCFSVLFQPCVERPLTGLLGDN